MHIGEAELPIGGDEGEKVDLPFGVSFFSGAAAPAGVRLEAAKPVGGEAELRFGEQGVSAIGKRRVEELLGGSCHIEDVV